MPLAAASAQQVIENPDKPQTKTAGRVIELREVLKITDAAGEFYFKNPEISTIGPDGSIFVQDKEQVLRFDKDGRFSRNYFKKGQGPGEMSYAGPIVFGEKSVCIQAIGPSKLVWFDRTGQLLKERPIRSPGPVSLNLRAILGDTYVFSGSEFPRVTGEPQYFENPYSIYTMKDGSEELKCLQSFPVKQYVVISDQGGGGMWPIGPFIAVPFQSRYLVLVHTCEYLVKIFDVEANSVIRTFTRKYKRVDSKLNEKKGGAMVLFRGKIYTAAPPQKYVNDVENVFIVKDAIWIVTSTKDPQRGVLIDVFDGNGDFTDSFYINIRDLPFAVFGDFCYTVEKNPDETYAVKKYEIILKN